MWQAIGIHAIKSSVRTRGSGPSWNTNALFSAGGIFRYTVNAHNALARCIRAAKTVDCSHECEHGTQECVRYG
jgi:hypothetical protein